MFSEETKINGEVKICETICLLWYRFLDPILLDLGGDLPEHATEKRRYNEAVQGFVKWRYDGVTKRLEDVRIHGRNGHTSKVLEKMLAQQELWRCVYEKFTVATHKNEAKQDEGLEELMRVDEAWNRLSQINEMARRERANVTRYGSRHPIRTPQEVQPEKDYTGTHT